MRGPPLILGGHIFPCSSFSFLVQITAGTGEFCLHQILHSLAGWCMTFAGVKSEYWPGAPGKAYVKGRAVLVDTRISVGAGGLATQR